ncbi:sensor histidine kinase [Actinacidiphila alni]|uniref:sensor histidine kinase n=1 Tax=Actinacidiphila alni TaxID=380248 RepID=UPI0034544DF5
MDRGSEVDVIAGGAGGDLPTAAARTLWWGSAGLVLAVPGTSVLVVGAQHGGRLTVAALLVLVQAVALRWAARAPVAVLAVNAASGLGIWALLPAVTPTGALLAAQIGLCVVSATRPPRTSLRALAAMCLSAPLAWAADGPASGALLVLAVVLAWTAGRWRRAHQARTAAETRRAVLEERARIAREVHDVVAHTLSVMVVQAAAADDVFGRQPEEARRALRAIETGARSALGELRLLLRAFGPEVDGDGSQTHEKWQPSLAHLDALADTVRATGLTVDVRCEAAIDCLPAAVDLAAYRIVQEALTNVLRHAAGADEAHVTITSAEGQLTVTVRDNGSGRQSVTAGGGRGLVGMRERARLVGGSVRTGPRPAGGYEVLARLPTEGAS